MRPKSSAAYEAAAAAFLATLLLGDLQFCPTARGQCGGPHVVDGVSCTNKGQMCVRLSGCSGCPGSPGYVQPAFVTNRYGNCTGEGEACQECSQYQCGYGQGWNDTNCVIPAGNTYFCHADNVCPG